jgi:hypothetical protein
MMKKILSILLVVGLLFIAADSFAQMNRFNPSQNIRVYTVANTYAAATGPVDASAAVSTDTIKPGYNRIIGYSVQILNTSIGAQCYVGLYDTTTNGGCTTGASGTMFGEAEAGVPTMENTKTVWFPYPKALANGLWIRQGINTVVTIYYEDYYGG